MYCLVQMNRKIMDADLIVAILLLVVVGAVVGWDMYKDKEK